MKSPSFKVISITVVVLVISMQVLSQPSQINKGNSNFARLEIEFNDAQPNDSFCIFLYKDFIHRLLVDTNQTAIRQSQGNFKISIPRLTGPAYFSLSKDATRYNYRINILELYLLEPGDDVKIKIIPDSLRNYVFSFSGKGSTKFQCRYQLDTSVYNWIGPDGELLRNKSNEAKYLTAEKILNSYKGRLASTIFKTLQYDAFATIELEKLEGLSSSHNFYIEDSIKTNKIFAKYQGEISKVERTTDLSTKLMSAKFAEFVVEKALLMELRAPNRTKLKKNANLSDVYEKLNKKYHGKLKDKILTTISLRLATLTGGPNLDLLHKSLDDIQTERYQNILIDYFDTNAKGKPAFQLN